MSDTTQGVFYFVILMGGAYAASRVMAKFQGVKFDSVLKPLAPVINGTFSTDSLNHGWLSGKYNGQEVHVTTIPGVGLYDDSSASERYNAFEVAQQNVSGASDWSLIFGSHSVGQILSRDESWRFNCQDEALKQRVQNSQLVEELQAFGDAGVRGQYPTVAYSARQKSLTHRANVSPNLAPTTARFEAQLQLVARLAQINKNLNPA